MDKIVSRILGIIEDISDQITTKTRYIWNSIDRLDKRVDQLGNRFYELDLTLDEFDRDKNVIWIKLSPDEISDHYLMCSGKESVHVIFQIEYVKPKYILSVCYFANKRTHYKYISENRDKIIEAILNHSRIGCDKVAMSVIIFEARKDDGNLPFDCQTFNWQTPFVYYDDMVRYYLRKAYESADEMKARQEREEEWKKIGDPDPIEQVFYL